MNYGRESMQVHVLLDIRADSWKVLFKYRPLKGNWFDLLQNKQREYIDTIASLTDFQEIQVDASPE